MVPGVQHGGSGGVSPVDLHTARKTWPQIPAVEGFTVVVVAKNNLTWFFFFFLPRAKYENQSSSGSCSSEA